jgi:acid phosphatase type 7
MKYQRVYSVLMFSFAACGNVSGHVSATTTGDTSHPAERRSPVAELRTACGDGQQTTLGAATIRRLPYLQQVTTSAASIGWVTTDTIDEHVDITTPDGAALSRALPRTEDVALRSADERQKWSRVDALQPSSIYCYELADETGALMGRNGFRTAPTADNSEPVRFLAFGDSGGGGSDQYALLEQMFTVPMDFMIHTGDLAYDSGSIGQIEDNVFGVYADLFKNLPFFPAAGNHDYATMRGAPFRAVFNLPGSTEKWYSYEWGRAHFAALDTESDYATQAAWLDQDLAATTLPWKIVYMHRPPYSSGTHGSDTALRAKLAPVLEKHHVQLVLAGHDHDYERMKPQNGVAYVVTGGGGVGTRAVGESGFTAISNDVIHFVYVEVFADQLVLHAIDASGREFDSMVVPQA